MALTRPSSTEIYVSTDVETDGPLPGVHSMRSLGSAAYAPTGELVSTYTANLLPVPGGATDPRTMAFWAGEPAAWSAVTRDPRPPEEVMGQYADWLAGLDGIPIFVGLPAVFDFGFVNHYLLRYRGENPFHRNAIDVRSFAMGATGAPWSGTRLADLPTAWSDGWEHDHTALGDATMQGRLFMRMMTSRRNGHDD